MDDLQQTKIVLSNKELIEEIDKIAKDIDKNLSFKIGECGFGRPCVGILHYPTEIWVGYLESAERPKTIVDAYHKHPCVAVLVHEDNYRYAIQQLVTWSRALKKGKLKVWIKKNDNLLSPYEPILIKIK